MTNGIAPGARHNAAGGTFPGSPFLLVSEGRNNEFLSDTFMLDLIQHRWFQRKQKTLKNAAQSHEF